MDLKLTLALRYLAGRKLRSVLTTLAIVFGVLVIFGMNSMMPAIVQAFQANAMAAHNDYDVVISNKAGAAFSQTMVDRVSAVKGVRISSGSLERTIGLPADYFDQDPSMPDRSLSVVLVGVDPESARSITAFVMVSGRFLEGKDKLSVVITQSLAQTAGVELGDSLYLPTPTGQVKLEIVGLLPQRVAPGNEEIYINLAQAQALFNMPGQINVIRANFDTLDQTARRQIERDISTALGSNFTIGMLQENAEILNNIRIAQVVFYILGGLGLLMGAFIIFNTFRTIVAERRRDIGMLRSIGADRSTIAWIVLMEGLIQGVFGTAAGLILGYLFAQGMLLAVKPIMTQFINIQFGRIAVQPGLVAISILAGVGVTLLAGILPANAASRLSPLEALRPAVGSMTLKRLVSRSFWVGLALIATAILALFTGNLGLVALGSFLFVTGLLVVSPSLVDPIARFFGGLINMLLSRDGTTRLAESNLVRQPGRAAITASTTMISLAILVMVASIVSSVMLSFTKMLHESLRSDYLLLPPSVTTWSMNAGAAPGLAQELREIEGVAVVSTLRFASTQINDVPAGLLGIEPRDYEATSGLTFVQGNPESAYHALESGRGIIVNGLLGTNAKVKMGDSLKALTADGEVSYTVVGIANDFLNAKTNTAYISQTNIAADFGRTEDVFFQINLVKGADRSAVEAALNQAIRPYPQFKLIVGQEYLQQSLSLFNAMFAGMVGMVLFLAIPSLIAMVNTLAIGVIERRREIGMLRAVGATRQQVGRVILFEALILAAIGTAFGLVAGLYLGFSAVGAVSAAGMSLEYVFPASGVIMAIASGLLFGALAAIIPARQAAGMPIVTALRYE